LSRFFYPDFFIKFINPVFCTVALGKPRWLDWILD